MALVIDQRPAGVSFADNPIIIKAHTTLKDKTFLRIIAHVTAVADNAYGIHVNQEDYTYTVAADGAAVFNIAETVRAAIRAYSSVERNGSTIVQKASHAVYTVVLKEVYLDNMIEVVGEEDSSIDGLEAVVGGLSEFERVAHPSWDAATFIGTGAVLSRKPDNEVVYGGHPVYVPVVANVNQTMQVKLAAVPSSGAATSGGSVAVKQWVPESLVVPTSRLADGLYQFSLVPSARSYTTRKFVRASDPGSHASFLFLNGFGVLESITCLTRRVKGYDVTADHYVEGMRVGQSVTSVINLGGIPTVNLQLTSGLVDRAWADWFACEFLPSQRVWMLMNGSYIPVSVEGENNLKLYDESRPEMCEVKFTVKCAVKGSSSSTVR